MRFINSILEEIGNTPLVRLRRIINSLFANIFVKAEYLNPSGSLKDRIALEMIRDAEKKGILKPGFTIIEASTGNTGTALSFVGTQLGYKVEIYMPKGMTPERIKIMENYGARVHELKLEKQDEGSVAGAEVEIDTRLKCLEIESKNHKVWWARQFSNPANTRAHVKTGREIINQLGDPIDAFVASIGVGGTLYGVSKALRELYPDVLIVGLEPASAKYAISDGFARVPETSDEVCGGIIEEMMNSGIVDKVVKVSNNDAIFVSDLLVQEEGLFCGISSGANVYMARKLAKELGPKKNVVTILPDHRDRYLSGKRYTT
jgi:cysteine synthase A